MVTNDTQNSISNLFVASIVALLFVLVAAAIVWVAQIRPSSTQPAAAEAPLAAEQAAAAPAQAEQAPAQPSKGDAAAGKQLFSTCAACHGPAGEGIQGLGKDMTTSQFIAGKTDDELVAFIKVGRTTSDPLNTTGVDMPPKGGNPALSDDDLYNIVAFIRTIHK